MKRAAKSNVIDIDVKASTRERAVQIAQALADAYLEIKAKMSDEVLDKQNVWLGTKITELAPRVEGAERRAAEFRKSKELLLTGSLLLPEQQLKDANTALIAARGRRADLESKVAELKAVMRNGGATDAMPDAVRSPAIEKLRADYSQLLRDQAYENSTLGPQHPSFKTTQAQLAMVRAQINSELDRTWSAQSHDLQTARSAEKAAEQLVNTLESSVKDLSSPKLQLDELERTATALRERYMKLLSSRESLHRDALSYPNSLLINQPFADFARSSPKTTQTLLMALAAAINLWIMHALLLEYFERRKAMRMLAESLPVPQGAPLPTSRADDAREVPISIETPRNEGISSRRAPLNRVYPAFFQKLPELSAGGSRIATEEGVADLRSLTGQAVDEAGGDYSAAINHLYQAVLLRMPQSWQTPVVAIASSQNDAGVSAITLSLAHAGCALGKKILLIERVPKRPVSGASSDALDAGAMPSSQDHKLQLYKRNVANAGEIRFAAVDETHVNWSAVLGQAKGIDLVLVDCGALRGILQFVPPAETVDALLLVDSETPDDLFEKHLTELGLAGRFIGIVSAPLPDHAASAGL